MRQIRRATNDDLEQVRIWLQREHDAGHRSFIVNIRMIEAGQREGRLSVLLDDGLAVAFALGDRNLDIFAVKRDFRGRGVGSELALHWIAEACERGLMGFDGECCPQTSLGFWRKIGCTQVRSATENPWIAMPIKKAHQLPSGLPIEPLTFQLHDSSRRAIPEWDVIHAAKVEDDDYTLAHDFVAYIQDDDARLTISGKEVWTEVGVRDIAGLEDIGGERGGPWLRIRNLWPR